MKQLNQYIIEKFKINSKTVNKKEYSCKPKDRIELREIIQDRLKEDKDADLNDIDISDIWTLNFLFQNLDPHNIDISQWDTSNVKHMNGVFLNCKNFNCDLSNWDVRNVQDMYAMFFGCEKFTGDRLEDWQPFSINNMEQMFNNCKSLKNKPSWYK